MQTNFIVRNIRSSRFELDVRIMTIVVSKARKNYDAFSKAQINYKFCLFVVYSNYPFLNYISLS